MTSSSPASSRTTDRPVPTTLAKAPAHIAAHEPFDAGHMRGQWVRWASHAGRLADHHSAELERVIRTNRNRNAATFVVTSYDTPIAWTDESGTLVVPAVRYTTTTSKHQYACRRAA